MNNSALPKMGRLMLNVLLSFAQFEREVTGECIRNKIAARKRKGIWMGGVPPLGYDVVACKLINQRSRGSHRAAHVHRVPSHRNDHPVCAATASRGRDLQILESPVRKRPCRQTD